MAGKRKNELARLKEIARILYLNNTSQKDIAERLAVSPQAISRWVKEGSWEAMRAAKQITRAELVNKALISINKLLDSAIENDAGLDGLGDKLAKIAQAIEKLDKKATVVDFIETFTEFEKWLISRESFDKQITDDLIKLINKLHDAYINEKLAV